MESNIRVTDNFVWLLVTKKSKDVFLSGLFDVYILYSDGSEALIECYDQLVDALNYGEDIGIEVGQLK